MVLLALLAGLVIVRSRPWAGPNPLSAWRRQRPSEPGGAAGSSPLVLLDCGSSNSSTCTAGWSRWRWRGGCVLVALAAGLLPLRLPGRPTWLAGAELRPLCGVFAAAICAGHAPARWSPSLGAADGALAPSPRRGAYEGEGLVSPNSLRGRTWRCCSWSCTSVVWAAGRHSLKS